MTSRSGDQPSVHQPVMGRTRHEIELEAEVDALREQLREAEERVKGPSRGHYADLEVVVAILRSDPREYASEFDANPKRMAEAVENIIATFSPHPGPLARSGPDEEVG